MDVSLIKGTIDSLRGKPIPLADVEKTVKVLAQSIGFSSIDAMLAYASTPPTRVEVPSDDLVLNGRKLGRIGEVLGVIPSDEQIAIVLNRLEEDVEGIVMPQMIKECMADIHPRLPGPFSSTPISHLKWKKIGSRLPLPYNATALRERMEKLEAASAAVGTDEAKKKDLAKEMEAFNREMAVFVSSAIDHWDTVFKVVIEMRVAEASYRQDTDAMMVAQRSEVDHCIDEILACIRSITSSLSLAPVIAAAAIRSGGEREKHIATTLDEFFRSITCRTQFRFYNLIRDFIGLPRDRSAIQSFLERMKFPPTHAAAIAGLTSRKVQIAATLGTVVFLML